METGRRLALRALNRWRKGAEFADRIVNQSFGHSSLGRADRAFALELFYGVLRNLTLLDLWIDQLRSGPLEESARDLLRLGLYQIMCLETAAHAAVFETVALAPARVRSLVNAVLRRALRERAALTSAAEAQPLHVRYSEPAFLVEKWSKQFGDAATLELCRWNNQPPPVYARVNQLRISVPEFLARYPGSFLFPQSTNFVGLADPAAAARSADCYIQDPSTLMAVRILDPKPGEAILDACAAPGGKTTYIAQLMQNRGFIMAQDIDVRRREMVRENCNRLGVRIVNLSRATTAVNQDLSEPFDRVIVDVPCSNTGVMRRRVDLRWRIEQAELKRLAATQIQLLEKVAEQVKPGGVLVYSTCSLEPEENKELVQRFVSTFPSFKLDHERALLPFDDGVDGAYVARMIRQP